MEFIGPAALVLWKLIDPVAPFSPLNGVEELLLSISAVSDVVSIHSPGL